MIAAPLGVADAVEGRVFGEAAEGGGVGFGKGFELGFALGGEGVADGGLPVVGADELAAVAAKGIAGEADVGREGFGTVFDGVVGGAACGVEQGDVGVGGVGDGVVGAGVDTGVAVGAAVGEGGVVVVGGGGGDEFADVAVAA